MKADFHDKPFDEGTLAKLEMFQIYAREWFPVFLSRIDSPWQNVHVFDFFAGPGQDVAGTDGSPVRVVREASACRHQLGSGKLNLHFHFSDADSDKTTRLETHILSGLIQNELEVVELCFKHGVRRQHSEQILKKLKSEGHIELEFRIPQFTHKLPRLIKIL